jgi:hypothetical protein
MTWLREVQLHIIKVLRARPDAACTDGLSLRCAVAGLESTLLATWCLLSAAAVLLIAVIVLFLLFALGCLLFALSCEILATICITVLALLLWNEQVLTKFALFLLWIHRNIIPFREIDRMMCGILISVVLAAFAGYLRNGCW